MEEDDALAGIKPFGFHGAFKSMEENDLDTDQGNQTICYVCKLPIFSTPYEKDDDGRCRHKCCKNLPEELKGHSLHWDGSLYLTSSSTSDVLRKILCDHCTGECGGFFYQCKHNDCKLNTLDVLCTGMVKILHRSHYHELVPFRSRALVTCTACGLADDREFYWCSFCDFFIHQNCALMTSTILHLKKHHRSDQQHILLLIYLDPATTTFLELGKCSFCSEMIAEKGASYLCISCPYAAHVDCVRFDSGTFLPVSSREASATLIHLPLADERTSVVQFLQEKMVRSSSAVGVGKKATARQLHDNRLIYQNSYSDWLSRSSPPHLCNACIQPISPPFYNCPQCKDFYLHNSCANLPLQYDHHSEDLSYTLHSKSPAFFGMFRCHLCWLPCNGYFYHCENPVSNLDLECALLPKAITHEAHGKSHILFLSFKQKDKVCHFCKGSIDLASYECYTCFSFILHVKCAFLPSSITHKFDRHQLKLRPSAFSTIKDVTKYFCEICELSINTSKWIYHCDDCLTSFHIDCIPYFRDPYSKVKFGGTIHLPCHDCPLISIRLLTSYSYTCSHCGRQIEGGFDGIAFECTKCRFWLHYDCAEEVKKDWIMQSIRSWSHKKELVIDVVSD